MTLPFLSTTSSFVFKTPANELSQLMAAAATAVTPATIGTVIPLVHLLPKLLNPSPILLVLVPKSSNALPLFVQLDSLMAISFARFL